MQINSKLPLIFGVPDKDFFKNLGDKQVFVSELRPGLEGMQAVSKECLKNKIEPVVICDNMMAFCMKSNLVKEVHIFSSHIENESAVCRTGSLIAALCAKAHGLPCILHTQSVKKAKRADLRKIGNSSVTLASIKTYVPETEEVSLRLVSKKD